MPSVPSVPSVPFLSNSDSTKSILVTIRVSFHIEMKNISFTALWTCVLDGVGGINLARVIWLVLATSTLSVLIQAFRTWYSLRHIPGPFLASITNFQRAWWVRTGRAHLYHQAVHEKYGELVRIGPRMVSFSNPSAIPVVYPIRPGFPKASTPPG